MALSSLTSTISTGFRWVAQNDLTGGVYSPIQNQGNINKAYNVGTDAGNTSSGGGDEVFSFQVPITAGSSSTLDLLAMTNLLNQTNVTIARIKGYQIRLLSATDDSTISPAPNAASTITVTNLGVTLPSPLDFHTGGSGLTVAVTVTSTAITGVSIGAAGSGYPKSTTLFVNAIQSGGSGGVITVTTNASGVPTAVAIAAAGTGYSAATLPTNTVGQYTILTGGAHMYFDVGANGFALVSSTTKNVKILNNDSTNAVTAEIDIIGAST